MYVNSDDLDLIIEIGAAPSNIGSGYYRQNCLFAGLDNKGKYHPIGHVIKNGAYYQQYYKEMAWSAFIIPYKGRPFVGKPTGIDYKLAFYGTPCIKKDGVVFINSKEEKTAADIIRPAKRSAIGVLQDGTIRLYTTQDTISLEELAKRMIDCVDILNLDGGGSVSPTAGWERPTSSALIVKRGQSMKHFETYTRMSSPYGNRTSPISGKIEFHTGIDLVKADKGEIYCTIPGRIVFAGMAKTGTGLGGFGNTVCVVDKNNHLHLYGHLDSVACKSGGQVAKGDLLGYQGNTGQSAGSHLHYEIRTKTTPSYGWRNNTDPLAYLDKYWIDNPETPNLVLSIKIANAIIPYLSRAWSEAKSVDEKKEIGLLANELRRLSGQPLQ